MKGATFICVILSLLASGCVAHSQFKLPMVAEPLPVLKPVEPVMLSKKVQKGTFLLPWMLRITPFKPQTIAGIRAMIDQPHFAAPQRGPAVQLTGGREYELPNIKPAERLQSLKLELGIVPVLPRELLKSKETLTFIEK